MARFTLVKYLKSDNTKGFFFRVYLKCIWYWSHYHIYDWALYNIKQSWSTFSYFLVFLFWSWDMYSEYSSSWRVGRQPPSSAICEFANFCLCGSRDIIASSRNRISEIRLSLSGPCVYGPYVTIIHQLYDVWRNPPRRSNSRSYRKSS